ncbi:MAG: zinc ribbon domain-containing protein [Methanobrevibacter thaueri]|nr:zinc ribbon domain-containing protein [Methanobrevibacter thaueri]
MELKNFFKISYNEIYNQNMDILEHYDLVNPLGSPNKLFLKFFNSKGLKINNDLITDELIKDYEDSVDLINLKLDKVRKEKEIIFKRQRVWINICIDNEWKGSDLFLTSDYINIDLTGEKIFYNEISNINIEEGSWSKKKIILYLNNDEKIIFEINENSAVPLKEILEDNIFDEVDQLLNLYSLFDEGKISEEEFELRKTVIYSDDLYCTNCGAKLESDSRFCSNCGYEIF